MTDTVSYILGVALSGAIGYILGTITHYRYMRVYGRSLIVPYIPAKGKGVTALLLVLALAVTGTVVAGQLERQRTQACQAEFAEALTNRAALTDEDRELSDEYRDLASDHRAAVDDLVTAIADARLAPDADDRTAAALDRYQIVVTQDRQAREDLDARRATVAEERKANPLPEPTCGR